VKLLCIEDLSGSTKAAARCRRTRDEVLSDLGGVDGLSTLERAATNHVSVLDAMLNDMGARWLQGEKIDIGALATLQNVFNRTATALGWQRRKKDVTPLNLDAYIKATEHLSDEELEKLG